MQATHRIPKLPTIVASLPRYNILQMVLICLRLIPMAALMALVLVFQQYIKPRIMIPPVRRYLSCVVNLFYLRIVLLLMGVPKFECQAYQYFKKIARTITFRSGWVGVAAYGSIVDFLYYSYLFNPVYARMVELLYTPLSFKEAFFAAFNSRGFDPIVLHGDLEYRLFKRRKLQMSTLISECFLEMNGPILVFIPSLASQQQLSIHQTLGEDMFDNQKKYLRSAVAFMTVLRQSSLTSAQADAQTRNKLYLNQLPFIAQICSRFSWNVLKVTAIEVIKFKYEYHRESFAEFVDEIFSKEGYYVFKMSFAEYNQTMRNFEKGVVQEQQAMSTQAIGSDRGGEEEIEQSRQRDLTGMNIALLRQLKKARKKHLE